MNKKVFGTMLLSSTIATNILSAGGTVVLATDIQENLDATDNTEENKDNELTVDKEIIKPEIDYSAEEETNDVAIENKNENDKDIENKIDEDIEQDNKNIDEKELQQQDGDKEVNEINKTDLNSNGENNKVLVEEKIEAKTVLDGPEIKNDNIFSVKHNIMGQAEVTKGGFKEFLRQIAKKYGYTYKLNCSIEEFVDLAYEESSIEGVRADVVIAQAIWETGYFQYGGIVDPDDNNYAGIGAVGAPGVKEKFESPRIGLRAQVQHLKAYASTQPLVKACVDPRFNYVTRGSAPSVEELAGKWAVPGYDTNKYSSLKEAVDANDSYGQKIYNVIVQASKYNGSPDVTPEKPNPPQPDGENNKPTPPTDSGNGAEGDAPGENGTPTLIGTGKVVNVNSGSVLNVRQSASTSASIVYKLRANEEVKIYEEKSDWYKISYNENGTTKYGYVSAAFIQKAGATNPPSNENKPETAPPVSNKIGVIKVSSALNVRKGPGTSYSVIGNLYNNNEVEILGEEGTWYKVKFSGKEGYVSKEYVTIKTQGGNTNPPTDKPSQSYKTGVTINVSVNLNVRKGAGTQYQVVGYLLPKTKVKITGESGTWYKILFETSMGEKEGYVSGEYLKVD